jgi:hypothetical protein
MDIDFLTELLTKTHNIVRYYRVGPLGDVPSINGKIVEEALRKVMVKSGFGDVATLGLIDLAVLPWNSGLQIKTFRKQNKYMQFARSDKGDKTGRILDIKNRLVNDLKRTHTENFYLIDVDTFTSDFSVYRLAKLQKDGTLHTFGSFLKEDSVFVKPNQTHFRILKSGLLKIA